MRRSRDRWLLLGLCGLFPAAACSRLTSVDWSQIKPPDASGGTGGTSASSAGEGGDVIGMGGENEAGQGGSFEGGAGGEAGADVGGTAGNGGMGGIAGGGTGGTAGSDTAGTAGGGTGGTAGGGSGGMGGNGGSPIVIIGGAGAIAQAVVLYDGGADAPNCNYGGRVGLSARCASKKGALPHSKTAAFISVSDMDELYDLTATAQVPSSKQIVSRTGVLLADNWVGLLGDGAAIGGAPKATLSAAGVLPEGARWLSGSTRGGTVDLDNTCLGWTSSTYDVVYQGRVARADLLVDPVDPNVNWLFVFRVACNTSNNHVLCLAYDP